MTVNHGVPGSSPGGGAKGGGIIPLPFVFKLLSTMKCFVYILQSEKTGGYYIGQAEDVTLRILQHNADINAHFTYRDRPWELKATLECSDRNHAMRLEAFIKKQKSRVFIEKIIDSSQVRESLILKLQ